MRKARLHRKRTAFGLALAIGMLALSTATAIAYVPALNAGWGARYHQNGACCGGSALDGSQATITISSISPDSVHCVLFSETVSDGVNRQNEVGAVKCGSLQTLDARAVQQTTYNCSTRRSYRTSGTRAGLTGTRPLEPRSCTRSCGTPARRRSSDTSTWGRLKAWPDSTSAASTSSVGASTPIQRRARAGMRPHSSSTGSGTTTQ